MSLRFQPIYSFDFVSFCIISLFHYYSICSQVDIQQRDRSLGHHRLAILAFSAGGPTDASLAESAPEQSPAKGLGRV